MAYQTLVPKTVPGFPTLNEGLWPDYQVSVLAGTSGAGKTTFLYQLMAKWAQGELAFGFSGPPGPYGLVAADRTVEAHKVTAAAVGLDWNQLVVRSLVDDPQIKLDDLEHKPFLLLFQLLDSVRAQLPQQHMARIIVDPLMVFLGVDLNKYHLVAARLLAVNRWCLARKALLIATHHATKARSDWSFKRPQDRIAGSGAMLAFTSTQGFLAAPEEIAENPEHQAELTLVSHHHPALTLRLIRNAIGHFEPVTTQKNFPHGVSWAKPPQVEQPPSAAALALLEKIPEAVPASRREIVAGAPQSAPTTDRALAELLDRGLIEKITHGVYRKLPRN
jgi:hypothetical protein